jgi:hypothetical protein
MAKLNGYQSEDLRCCVEAFCSQTPVVVQGEGWEGNTRGKIDFWRSLLFRSTLQRIYIICYIYVCINIKSLWAGLPGSFDVTCSKLRIALRKFLELLCSGGFAREAGFTNSSTVHKISHTVPVPNADLVTAPGGKSHAASLVPGGPPRRLLLP